MFRSTVVPGTSTWLISIRIGQYQVSGCVLVRRDLFCYCSTAIATKGRHDFPQCLDYFSYASLCASLHWYTFFVSSLQVSNCCSILVAFTCKVNKQHLRKCNVVRYNVFSHKRRNMVSIAVNSTICC